MNDPFRDLLRGLNASLSGKNLEEKNERVREDAIVKYLLSKFGLDWARRELSQHSNTHFGSHYLRLQGFYDRFPSFPVYMRYRTVKGLQRLVNRMSLFNNFVNLPFMDAYSDMLNHMGDEADNRAIGMVMSWGTMQGGMVLHNCELDPDNDGVRLVWIHRNKKAKVTQRLVLEPMSSLLRSLRRWTPDD